MRSLINTSSYHSTPPKEQGNYERWSLVYFTRPQRDAELRALTDQSSIIADAVARSPDPSKFNTGQTAGAWFARRIKNQRIANRTVSLDRNFHLCTGFAQWVCYVGTGDMAC